MEIKVRFVDWKGIPKGEWHEVLEKACPVGGYIKDLPYNIPENMLKIRIPLVRQILTSMINGDNSFVAPEIKYMEFEKTHFWRIEKTNGLFWTEDTLNKIKEEVFYRIE